MKTPSFQQNADEMPPEFRDAARAFGSKFYKVTTKASNSTLKEFQRWFERLKDEHYSLTYNLEQILKRQGRELPKTPNEITRVMYEEARRINGLFSQAKLDPPPLTVYRGLKIEKSEAESFIKSLQSGVFVTSAAHSSSVRLDIANEFAADYKGNLQVVMRISGVTRGLS